MVDVGSWFRVTGMVFHHHSSSSATKTKQNAERADEMHLRLDHCAHFYFHFNWCILCSNNIFSGESTDCPCCRRVLVRIWLTTVQKDSGAQMTSEFCFCPARQHQEVQNGHYVHKYFYVSVEVRHGGKAAVVRIPTLSPDPNEGKVCTCTPRSSQIDTRTIVMSLSINLHSLRCTDCFFVHLWNQLFVWVLFREHWELWSMCLCVLIFGSKTSGNYEACPLIFLLFAMAHPCAVIFQQKLIPKHCFIAYSHVLRKQASLISKNINFKEVKFLPSLPFS